jgi:hypothetical protein
VSIAGKVINGRLVVTYEGVDYPLIKSNAKAVEAYLHTGDAVYLRALASEANIDRFSGDRGDR